VSAERVLLRRVQTLLDGIDDPTVDRPTLRFIAEQVESTAAKIAGTRGREVDDLRRLTRAEYELLCEAFALLDAEYDDAPRKVEQTASLLSKIGNTMGRGRTAAKK
jgi:hypothetical protein